MIFAGILAGGSGERVEKASIPKQFVKIGGIPIFIRTLYPFFRIGMIDKVIVSINVDWRDTYEKLLYEYKIDREKIELVGGGNVRRREFNNYNTRLCKAICINGRYKK